MRFRAALLRVSTISAALGMLLNGCSGPSPDKVRSAVVAEAAGGKLTGAMLERWLVTYRFAPTKETVNILVSAWINSSLLIDAIRSHAPLDDSATVDAAISPDAARGLAMQYFATRHTKIPAVTDKQVDSLAGTDEMKVFQQILVRVPKSGDSATVRLIGERAQALASRVAAGASFTELVKEASEDSLTRANNGFTQAISHSALPPSLASLWTLLPGQALSRIVGGPGGYYLFRRASRAEEKPGLRAWLAPQIVARADAAFFDSLARAHPVILAGDAASRLRSIAVEPVVAPEGSPLATWDGGALTPATVRIGVLMLTPSQRASLTNASDSGATRFVTDLARREILTGLVTHEPLPTAYGRQMLGKPLRQAIDSLRAVVSRLPASLSPGEVAARQIDSSLAGRPQFLPLPGALAGVLRSRSPVTVNPKVSDDVLHIAEPAWQLKHRNDTTVIRPRPKADSSTPL